MKIFQYLMRQPYDAIGWKNVWAESLDTSIGLTCCSEHKRFDNNTDINIRPNAGVGPRALQLADVTGIEEGKTCMGSAVSWCYWRWGA